MTGIWSNPFFILCISAQTGYGLRRMIIKNLQTVLWIMRSGHKTQSRRTGQSHWRSIPWQLPLGTRQKSSKNLHPTMESPQLMNNSPMQSMSGMWQSMTRRPRQRGMNFPTGAAGTGQGISLCMICQLTGMEVMSYSLHYRDWGIRTRRHSAEPGTMWTAVT